MANNVLYSVSLNDKNKPEEWALLCSPENYKQAKL